jgi:hypothetical protein
MFTFFRRRKHDPESAILKALATEYAEIAREQRILAEIARRHEEILVNPRRWERRPRRRPETAKQTGSPRRTEQRRVAA